MLWAILWDIDSFGSTGSPLAGFLESLLDQLDGGEAAKGREAVPVLLPVALDQTYDYFTPPDAEAEGLRPGSATVGTASQWWSVHGGAR